MTSPGVLAVGSTCGCLISGGGCIELSSQWVGAIRNEDQHPVPRSKVTLLKLTVARGPQ